MGTHISHKRSEVTGSAPLGADINTGELALNITDQKIFTKKSDNTIIEMTNKDNNLVKTGDKGISKYIGYDQEYDAGSLGAGTTINFTDKQVQRLTIDSNNIIAMVYPKVGHYQLKLINTGTFNPSSWTNINYWLGSDVPPPIKQGIGAMTFVSVYYDGTNAFAQMGYVGAV